MYYIKLTNGTTINNCTEETIPNNIVHVGETYADAVSILNEMTEENTSSIRVYNENDELVSSEGNLVLSNSAVVINKGEYKTCTVTLRRKSEMEVMQDQISELQEAIIEE